MASTNRRGRGLIVVGVVFMIGGAIWSVTGKNIAIGSSQFTLGIVFLMIGMAAGRKAHAAPVPPNSTETRRHV